MIRSWLKSGIPFLLVLPALVIYSACEKIEPITLNNVNDVDFSCESCHTNSVVLAQLAPDEGGEAAGGGG